MGRGNLQKLLIFVLLPSLLDGLPSKMWNEFNVHENFFRPEVMRNITAIMSGYLTLFLGLSEWSLKAMHYPI